MSRKSAFLLVPDSDKFSDASSKHESFSGSTEPLTPEEVTKQKAELEAELFKVEEEIKTLESVLAHKRNKVNELKAKLNIKSPLQDIRDDINHGLKSIKESQVYRRTSGTIHDINKNVVDSNIYKKSSETISGFGESISENPIYQKTTEQVKKVGETITPILKTASGTVTEKIGELKNTKVFQSFEEGVAGAYTSVKAKVTGLVTTNTPTATANKPSPTNE